MFGPISSAHFNPAVTLAFALHREISPKLAAAYVAVQMVGALFGYLFRDVSASQSTHTRVR